MTENEPIKVYELAKELGIQPLSLVDKLRDLQIVVKNHMSELAPAQVELARSSLNPKKEEKAAPKKKAAASGAAPKTRKKAADAAPAASKPAASSKKEATAAPAAGGAPSPIIRRRARADEIETAAPAPAAKKSESAVRTKKAVEPEAEEVDETTEEIVALPETDTAVETPEASVPAMAAASTATPVAKAGPVTKAGPVAPTITPIIVAPAVPSVPKRSILKIVDGVAGRVTIGGLKIISQPKPEAAGAVGAVGDPKSKFKGQATERDGFRIIKMTKENIDQMAEEEAAKKRGAGGREANIKPEDVRLADYRKKEMVFLPKKKKLPIGKQLNRTEITTPNAKKRIVEMGDTISVQELASQLGVKANEVIKKLMGLGIMATMNQAVDFDTATILGTDYQHEVRNVAFKETAVLAAAGDDEKDLTPRPPIVTIMGHVDHGKTSLLDAIREADVAAHEAGGITQHIGAYTIVKDGHLITFIDTPGHEAFTLMRARGANATDIVILVVAADDGVMPQTREALAHAKAAKVPIIVAVNKIDKPGANPEKVKQELAELDLLAEDWGGDSMFVPVSATKKTNLDKLLEAILLNAEVLQLKANAKTLARGGVLEARLEKGRGPMVSLLVRRGTLRVGDFLAAGLFGGKVKAMMDHRGQMVKEVTPGMAAEVLGFDGVPNPGDQFDALKADSDVRQLIGHREDLARDKQSNKGSKMSLEELFSKIQAGDTKELRIILKADVGGSVEAVRDSLTKLSTVKVKVNVIHAQAGGITESDVLLATASNAIIIGFNVRPETKARGIAENEKIEVKCYNIIYELLDDVRKSMTGLLEKKKVEKFLGRAEVRQTFSVPKIGTIAGCSVVDGKIIRGANLRLLRDSRVIYEGKMSSLRRFKDDAKEVAQGYECGIGIEGYTDLKMGDLIEAYQIELVEQELGPSTGK